MELLHESDRLLLIKHVSEVLHLEGVFAELGVSIGDSAETVCKIKGDKEFHLFDTFEGHPKGWVSDIDHGQNSRQVEGGFSARLEKTQERLKEFTNLHWHKGLFPETAIGLENKLFSYVNLDTDLYKSTYEGLRFFLPRIVKGGIITIHDHSFMGVSKAINEFGLRGECISKDFYLIKHQERQYNKY